MRGREVIGLPVIDLDRGERLGTVGDVVIDLANRRLVALVVEGNGLFKTATVLDLARIKALGQDAVTVAGLDVPARCPEGEGRCRSGDLIGRMVLDNRGSDMGVLDDLVFDNGGGIRALVLSGGVIQDILDGQEVFPVDGELRLGKEAFIIAEGRSEGP